MTVKELHLRDFTAFSAVDLRFSDRLNLFIGENGTGKSHVMKAIHSLLRGAAEVHRKGSPTGSVVADEMGARLAGVYRPAGDVLAHLVRHQAPGRAVEGHVDAEESDIEPGGVVASVGMTADTGETQLSIAADASLGPGEAVVVARHQWNAVPQSLFIPAREVLSLFEGFIAAYERHRLSFDETYYDLCVALDQQPLRDQEHAFVKDLCTRLEELLGGTVHRESSRFYVDFGTGNLEAHLVAEGHRKLASLVQLVRNGAIAPGSVLLWDEPEANLNPRLIVPMAAVLVELARAGVQVFVSTHDYLLSRELVALGQKNARIFSLFRDEELGEIHVEVGESLEEIDHNPIIAEYARQYEREVERFHANGDEE